MDILPLFQNDGLISCFTDVSDQYSLTTWNHHNLQGFRFNSHGHSSLYFKWLKIKGEFGGGANVQFSPVSL